jgi:hypothetical protein
MPTSRASDWIGRMFNYVHSQLKWLMPAPCGISVVCYRAERSFHVATKRQDFRSLSGRGDWYEIRLALVEIRFAAREISQKNDAVMYFTKHVTLFYLPAMSCSFSAPTSLI